MGGAYRHAEHAWGKRIVTRDRTCSSTSVLINGGVALVSETPGHGAASHASTGLSGHRIVLVQMASH